MDVISAHHYADTVIEKVLALVSCDMSDRLWMPLDGDVIPESQYRYRTVSVEHLPELQDDFNSFDEEGRVSNNPTFRKYISSMNHALPETFPDAKFVIVLAVYTPLLKTTFHYKGRTHEVLVPHYYNDGITETHLIHTIQNQIIGSDVFRVENAKMHVLLKRLVSRSGLGRYGRNNLCYVGDMGSFIRLHAFFTDYMFKEDSWTEAKLLDSCSGCKSCHRSCPTGSINEDDFIIDIEKCIPLYNEVPGVFPNWLDSVEHSALMGCLKCQLSCPANCKVVADSQRLEDISEEETNALLEEAIEGDLITSLSSKTRMFDPKEAWYFVPVLARNLRALISH